MARKSNDERAERWENSAWKTKWEGRIPETEEEWREQGEALVEYLEARYDLPPRGTPATITKM